MAPPDAGREWVELQRIVDGALELPPAARAAYLESACRGDTALRQRAARLLKSCERAEHAEGLFAAPADAFAAPLFGDDAAEALRAAAGDRYRIERELGRGGMATVYLARDLRHDRPVAIKVLARHLGPIGADRFLHEIRITARLTHPHVLGVHDSGDAEGYLFYVMPYVRGETLRSRLAREGALPVAEAERLVRELADALAYAHGAGIVHRDLKPENILLSAGHAVVADFGIAKAIAVATEGGFAPGGGLTGTGMSLGTPAYMAPEQAIGAGSVDFRADLYALGVIAYEALTGAHPFGERSAQAIVAAHLTEEPAPLLARRADVPSGFASLVMRLLAKSPDDRPENASAVLRALASGEYVASPPSRGRARSVLAIAAAFALVGIVGYAVAAGMGARRGIARDRDAAAIGSAMDTATSRTVAVIPFENTGGDPADTYFSDGLTDELAHALSRLRGVRVAGRTSSYAFKGRNLPAQQIGESLDVRALVNGAVQRAGDRLRVRAQLVSTADGKIMWDSVYESRTGDVFEVQDEVTRAIAAALAPTLSVADGSAPLVGSAGRGTRDQEAYDLYLKGRYHVHERGAANLMRAIEYFQRAIARDPQFARAHAGLALAYGIVPSYVPDAADSTRPLMIASADRAVRLDSSLADAHIALGLMSDARLDIPGALARLRTAIALEPTNPFAYHLYGMLLLSVGRLDAAIDTLGLAAQLDPLAKSALTAYAGALADAGRFPEAEAVARRVLAIDSTFPIGRWALGYVQAFGGAPDSAVRNLEAGIRFYPNHPGSRPLLTYAYAAAGRWTDAARVRADLHRDAPRRRNFRAEAAVADLVFGDREPLLRLLETEEGLRGWSEAFAWFGCNRLLDPVRAEPRFRDAMRSLGVAPCPIAQHWSLPPRPRQSGP